VTACTEVPKLGVGSDAIEAGLVGEVVEGNVSREDGPETYCQSAMATGLNVIVWGS